MFYHKGVNMSFLSMKMLAADMSKIQVYKACAEGYIALEDFDLPQIEEMIELGFWKRECVNAYFAEGSCKCGDC